MGYRRREFNKKALQGFPDDDFWVPDDSEPMVGEKGLKPRSRKLEVTDKLFYFIIAMVLTLTTGCAASIIFSHNETRAPRTRSDYVQYRTLVKWNENLSEELEGLPVLLHKSEKPKRVNLELDQIGRSEHKNRTW
jgi:hypothetical protein